MRNANAAPAGEVVDHWNHYFFNPRHMHVVLAKGAEQYSGLGDEKQPSAWRKELEDHPLYHSSDIVAESDGSSDSDSDSDDDFFNEQGAQSATGGAELENKQFTQRQAREHRQALEAEQEARDAKKHPRHPRKPQEIRQRKQERKQKKHEVKERLKLMKQTDPSRYEEEKKHSKLFRLVIVPY